MHASSYMQVLLALLLHLKTRSMQSTTLQCGFVPYSIIQENKQAHVHVPKSQPE